MAASCQRVAILTTTTVRTTSTHYVTVIESQAVAPATQAPLLSTVFATSSTCVQSITANKTTERCTRTTYESTLTLHPTAQSPSTSIIKITSTIATQIYGTQTNVLFSTSCQVRNPSPQQVPSTPSTLPPSTPPPPTPPPPTPTPSPTTDPTPIITTTAFTTDVTTVTSSSPPIETSTPPTSSTKSQSIVTTPAFVMPTESIVTVSSTPATPSNSVPGTIAGVVVGCIVVLAGLAAYFLLFKKSCLPFRRHAVSVDESTNDQHSGSNSDRPVSNPQMQEQAGYYDDNPSYGQQQYQGSTDPSSFRYSGYNQTQGFNAQDLYTNSQSARFWQQQNVGYGAATGPMNAQASSSSGYPSSYLSTAPLLGHGSLPQQQRSFVTPYRGYAEPAEG